MIESTGKFKVKEIIFNNGKFAVATGAWQGINGQSVACRWHDDGIGYPQTFGKAQWMLLPEGTKVDRHDVLNENQKVSLTLG